MTAPRQESVRLREAEPATLWSILDWAEAWNISERQCQTLRKHPHFPADGIVQIGARCVRFRVARLNDFAAALAATRKPIPEPERLRRARQERQAQRDPSAAWIRAGQGNAHIGSRK